MLFFFEKKIKTKTITPASIDDIEKASEPEKIPTKKKDWTVCKIIDT